MEEEEEEEQQQQKSLDASLFRHKIQCILQYHRNTR